MGLVGTAETRQRRVVCIRDIGIDVSVVAGLVRHTALACSATNRAAATSLAAIIDGTAQELGIVEAAGGIEWGIHGPLIKGRTSLQAQSLIGRTAVSFLFTDLGDGVGLVATDGDVLQIASIAHSTVPTHWSRAGGGYIRSSGCIE